MWVSVIHLRSCIIASAIISWWSKAMSSLSIVLNFLLISHWDVVSFNLAQITSSWCVKRNNHSLSTSLKETSNHFAADASSPALIFSWSELIKAIKPLVITHLLGSRSGSLYVPNCSKKLQLKLVSSCSSLSAASHMFSPGRTKPPGRA